MKQTLIAMLLAGTGLLMSAAQAQTPAPVSASASTAASAPAAKKTTKKVVKKKAAPAPVEEDEKEPDVTGTTVSDYQCELGIKLTIFQNNDSDDHIALKWGKRIHQMDRIHTTTGASRYENKHYGYVWIGIPDKGILLDSKTGHQLANECRTAEQRAEQAAEKMADKAAEAGQK